MGIDKKVKTWAENLGGIRCGEASHHVDNLTSGSLGFSLIHGFEFSPIGGLSPIGTAVSMATDEGEFFNDTGERTHDGIFFWSAAFGLKQLIHVRFDLSIEIVKGRNVDKIYYERL